MMKAKPMLPRQLSLEGTMLLWRDREGGGREGLLLTTDVCTNLACTDRHIGVDALLVDDALLEARFEGGAITTTYPPDSESSTRHAFFVSLGLDDGAIEPQGRPTDAGALSWFRSELDLELMTVLRARFDTARKKLREEAARQEAKPQPGRNDPCPCGSGLKYKRCCMGKAA